MSGDDQIGPQTLKKSDYEYYPRTLPPDDFWGQVRRTVHGVPVSEEQIQMIVDALLTGLALVEDDAVLDIACGNGALSGYLYPHCASLFGVDMSEYLISVAKTHFEMPPKFTYHCDEAAHYVATENDPGRFTKVLCYGSFPFFPAQSGQAVLTDLRRRFTNVTRVVLGNLPDRDMAELFFEHGVPSPGVLDDHTEQIGVWRSREQMSGLAQECGWDAQFSTMPSEFYARAYRYDVLLTPA
jgi:cyclopropane fatty-acyl-phospholipid synthase-like methyltransferase